jgi:hypothetical protein
LNSFSRLVTELCLVQSDGFECVFVFFSARHPNTVLKLHHCSNHPRRGKGCADLPELLEFFLQVLANSFHEENTSVDNPFRQFKNPGFGQQTMSDFALKPFIGDSLPSPSPKHSFQDALSSS